MKIKGLTRRLSIGSCLFYLTLSLNHSNSLDSYSSPSAKVTSLPGWSEAAPGYTFSFPRDHASHPAHRLEWWYYTGNLESKDGRRFGYQLTFFKVGVTRAESNISRWALRDLYMTHFAISDIERQEFHAFERINRSGVGWAGADPIEEEKTSREKNRNNRKPGTEFGPGRRNALIRAWNEDWAVQIDEGTHSLQAADETYSIDLRLTSLKPEVIHGEHGISQKGPLPRNASHYYSLTRMETSGRLVVGGESFEVTGLSWMDHEFGTSFLEQQSGWDWFSIQLEDGRDLMLFELHQSDGVRDPRSSGTLVEPNGSSIHLSYQEFSLVPLRKWRSPATGASYPVSWEISLPRYGTRLTVTAAFDDQELETPESTGVTYWEGSVVTAGTYKDRNVSGRGYLEMTGYSGPALGAMLR